MTAALRAPADDAVRLSMLGLMVRRRWRLLVALAILGGLVGAAASPLLSPGYRTATSVLLQGPRAPDVLRTEAQIAMSPVVLDRAGAALGWNVTGTELQDAVTAEVAAGNIVTVTATADSPERAQQLADQVAQEYVRFATQLVSDTADASAQAAREQRELLRQQVEDTNDRITELHASVSDGLTVENVQIRTDLEAMRAALTQAINKLEEAEEASGRAKMVVMGRAERPSSPASPTMAQLAAGGALLFVLAGVFGHFVVARSDRRLRTEPEIAAALGSPVVASVDVPDAPAQPPGRTSLRSTLRRLLVDDQPWDVPPLSDANDEAIRQIRYRRVFARLRGGAGSAGARPAGAGPAGPRRVVALVADDDPVARAAATRLAAIADDDPAAGAVLDVTEVRAAQPIVPDARGAAGVLVVLGAGTRTGWELVGITEACADAGHPVLGAVVALRSRPVGRRGERGKHGKQAEPDGPDGADRMTMAGSP